MRLHMHIKTKFLSALVISFFICSHSLAQNTEPSFFQTLTVTARMNWGSLFAENAKSKYVKDSYAFLGELDISSRTYGKKSWQQFNGYPEIGIAFLYGNPGSLTYVGHIGSAFGFASFPLMRSKIIKADFRMGFGAGWVEKPFDPRNNYKNLLIGSRLNACINFLLSTQLQVTRQIALDAGFSFTHLSNGSVKVPNYGLNIPGISLGLKYIFNPDLKFEKKKAPPLQKKWGYYLFSFAAAKESYPLESAVYLVNVLNFEMLKDFSHTARFGGGVNFTYDRAASNEIPYSATYEFDKSKFKLQASIYAAYEYVMGNLSVPVQLGVYLYNNYAVQALYQNIGIRYRFAPHWIAGVELKAHLGNGDFIQWGIGYKF